MAQHSLQIEATLVPADNTISIHQTIVFKNTSNQPLNEIYLLDWANSFSSKTSPLAKRFAEDYESAFYFERSRRRGRTKIGRVYDASNNAISWERGEEVDILKINPLKPLAPGDEYTFVIEYQVKIPNARFTRFGVTRSQEYRLKYWFIAPAVFDGEWQTYSNKNTDDLYMLPSKFDITFRYPKEYFITSDLDIVSEQIESAGKLIKLTGENRMSADLYFEKSQNFYVVDTDKLKVITNQTNSKLNPPIQAMVVDRAVHFLDSRLGPYPFDKMLISEIDYRTNPVYGLNLLPDFISPFPDGFEFDMEQFKTISRHYINNVLVLHPRKDYWLQNALQIYMMMEYVETYYPNMKILGNLGNWWALRWAQAAKMDFNDQYQLLYMNMARQNIHQALSTEKDSLLKFNMNIANPYYGGNGFQYLKDYIGGSVLDQSIKELFSNNQLKPIQSNVFEQIIEEKTSLPVNWFFEDYIESNKTIDFKIKKVVRKQDSLEVIVENRRNTSLPVSVYGLNKDEVVYKTWTEPVEGTTSITIPSKDVRKLALNYEAIIPEFNQRNNYKAVEGLMNRPIQFRLFQDVENPKYNQIFFIPVFQYNLYDGLSAGVQLYNKTFLPKALSYSLEPQLGLKSNTIVGSGSILYTQFRDEDNLYAIHYGFSGNYYSYDRGLFYKRFSPYMTFAFRPKDLRKSERQYINIRSVNVHRDYNENDPNQDPNYNVFNGQYVYSNPHLINFFRAVGDYQISSKFSKISLQLEYRKLFLNNRQLNLRFFAGTFLFNDTAKDGDFFSFALDRPSDYMFDYNYYGRSEDTGLFSQQLIIAEGGFKSKLNPGYADRWIATLNASTNIWKWIYVYGDVGLLNHSSIGTKAVYDSGLRFSLVTDYFELYLPMYSSLGFEPGLPEYGEKIRFIVTLSPETLFKLFTRRWY